jgi:serine/threonine protein kinase
MPAPTSVPEFLDLVRRSQLLQDNRLDEFAQRHRSLGTLSNSIDQVANQIVREGLITFFQAKQIKLGRYKRFTIGSKYRLLELIGAGGMGAVYLCEHTLMRRLVALKVLPLEKLEDESNKERFYREARAVAALDHPNIVRAYDIDTFEKLHFLVMEYVDGTSLQEVVARYILDKKLFDPIRAAHYIAQSAVGMQHAHELGMVHRDIKPGNLLLDRSGVIKVLDMGLARFFNKQQDSVTEKYDHNCVLGTADYLAPEQAVSNQVDIRADIYALGGTFYFMLTGQTPFPDGTIAAKLVAHQTREPRPVESFRSDVPSGLLAVLRRMMARNREERFQQPIEVVDALSEWADQAITAPPSREMPIHCQLVQSLAGPAAPGSGSTTSLARALFGPGRGVFARSSGGSSVSDSGNSSVQLESRPRPGSTGKFEEKEPSSPKFSKSKSKSSIEIPLSGSVSTSRAMASPTAPLQSPDSASEDSPSVSGSTVVYITPPRRTGIYILVGIVFTLMSLVVAVAAYQIGKGGKKEMPSSEIDPAKQTQPQTPAPKISSGGSVDDALSPGLADRLLSPHDASKRIGEIQTVEFKVASISENHYMSLNSEKSEKHPDNMAVRIAATYFSQGTKAGQEDSLRAFTRSTYDDGKVIRARGKLHRDEKTQTTYLEVQSPEKQIVLVRDR